MTSWRTAHNHGWPVRRARKRKAIKRWLEAVNKVMAVHFDCPDRPWFKLTYRD